MEVISAMPLSEVEQKKVQGEIGVDKVTFLVDPKILGGLILRSGNQIIDGSVSNNLDALAAKLQ